MVKDWKLVKIGELLDFKNGLNKGKDFFGSGTPIINYMDVYKKSGLYSADIAGKVSLDEKEIKRYEVKKGDVFFTRTSETPEEVGLASVLLDDIDACVFSGFVLRGRPKTDMLLPAYCKYCFSTHEVRQKIIANCTYTTRALTNGTQLSKIEISVPDKDEQFRIAASLTAVDQLIDKSEKLVKKYQALKQACLQHMFPREGQTEPDVRLPGFTDPWEQRKVSEITDRYDNMRIPVTANRRVSGDIPYYGANGIQDYVKGYTHNGEFILVAEDGANDLKNYPVHYVNGKIWVNNHAHVLQAKSTEADNRFLQYAISQADIGSFLVGGGRTKLNANVLMDIDLTLPNFPEQIRIGEYFSNLDKLITLHQRTCDKYKNIKQGMMEALLSGKTRLI